MKKSDKKAYILRHLSIIDRAVNEFGLEIDEADSLSEMSLEAEKVLFDNVIYDDIEECDFSNGLHQHYLYIDEKGVCYESDGEIVNFDRFRNGERYAYNYEKKQFEENKEGEYFAVDTIVDSNAKVIKLIAE